MLHTGVEGRVGHEKIAGPRLLQPARRIGDLLRIEKPHHMPLDLRIGAVDAVEAAAALGLEVQHAAILEIVAQMRQLRVELPDDAVWPWGWKYHRGVLRDDAGNRRGIPMAFYGLQQQDQPFALADNSVVGPQRAHRLARKDRKSAAAEDNRRGGAGAHVERSTLCILQKNPSD